MKSKRGASQAFIVIVVAIIILASVIAVISLKSSQTTAPAQVEQSRAVWTDKLGDSAGKVLSYVFGPIAKVTNDDTSSMIITLAVWLLIFITFGDIISSFSTFSSYVSWGAAFLIGIIASNLGIVVGTVAWTTGVFAFLGTLAVYAGLVGAFVVFIALNLGVTSLGPFIMRRKMMEAAQKTETAEEAGGKKLKGAIKGMGSAGEALESVGKKKPTS